jgi:hypothetical protein
MRHHGHVIFTFGSMAIIFFECANRYGWRAALAILSALYLLMPYRYFQADKKP